MMKTRSFFASACAVVLSLAGCGSTDDGSVTQSSPLVAAPRSIHNLPLPLTQRVGVVVEITSGTLGVPRAARDAANAFTEEVRRRNNAIHAADGRLMFVAASIDASAALSSGAAARQIADEDAAQVAQGMRELSLDQQTVRSQIVLFFNDEDQAMKRLYGNARDNPTAAVVNLAGDVVAIYKLPAQKAAALAALDRAQAATP